MCGGLCPWCFLQGSELPTSRSRGWDARFSLQSLPSALSLFPFCHWSENAYCVGDIGESQSLQKPTSWYRLEKKARMKSCSGLSVRWEPGELLPCPRALRGWSGGMVGTGLIITITTTTTVIISGPGPRHRVPGGWWSARWPQAHHSCIVGGLTGAGAGERR